MTILVDEENRFNDELRLDSLKWRVKNCKCKYCGAPLRLRRIIYGNNPQGRVEIFCTECNRIEYGVEPEIYTVAKYFVEEFNFNIFPNNDDSEKTKQMNVAKAEEYIESLLQQRQLTPPPRRATYILKDVRLFLNSVERSVRFLQRSGIEAAVGRQDNEGEILLTIRIANNRANT